MRDAVIGFMTKLLEYATILSMSTIVLVLSINVFLRYVMHHPFPWAEEISILMMMWVIFLGGGLLQKRDEHVAITYVFDLFSAKWKNMMIIFGNFSICLVLVIHLLSSLKLLKLQMRTFTPSLRLPMTYFALAALVGVVAMLLYTIDSMTKNLKNRDLPK